MTHPRITIALLGDSKVGKSSLFHTWVTAEAIDEDAPYIPTIALDINRRSFEENEIVILDVACSRDQSKTLGLQVKTSNVLCIMYDVTDRVSFENVRDWKAAVAMRLDCDDIPICLVGTKCDMAGQRKVTYDEGEAMATTLETHFVETTSVDITSANLVLRKCIQLASERDDIVSVLTYSSVSSTDTDISNILDIDTDVSNYDRTSCCILM